MMTPLAVTKALSSQARLSAALTIPSTWPLRPSGVWLTVYSKYLVLSFWNMPAC